VGLVVGAVQVLAVPATKLIVSSEMPDFHCGRGSYVGKRTLERIPPLQISFGNA
jgi:hypothetical protein